MSLAFRPSSLAPPGLVVDDVISEPNRFVIKAHGATASCPCPACGCPSTRVHSRYTRWLTDLPSAGKSVHLEIVARRFRCIASDCQRRIFVEPFGPDLVARFARRTGRLDCIVHHLGLALGGRPAAIFARRLMLPVSNDTLLRMVRRRARLRAEPLSAIGIDDWAWHKGHRYGSIVCDLQRRRIVTLLADREVATVEAWLRHHPEIMVIARDRGGGYGEAASRALPNAIQVADRWHLIENASAALLDVVRKSMRLIRNAIGATTIDRELLTSAERLQHDGYLRREEANAAIMAMAKDGVSIKQIVRQTGHSRKTVRQVIRGARADVFRSRMNSLEPYLLLLDSHWTAGCSNGAELWRRLKADGFGGSPRVVSEWATRRRRTECVTEGQLRKVPSARTIVWMMTMARDHLTKADSVIVAAIEAGAPMLTEARRLVERFQTMIRKKANKDLDPWISDANPSLIASFARGVAKDKAAVLAAITEPWSNGQTEGHITKLKLIKRQMFGRAKLDLLQARLIGVA